MRSGSEGVLHSLRVVVDGVAFFKQETSTYYKEKCLPVVEHLT